MEHEHETTNKIGELSLKTLNHSRLDKKEESTLLYDSDESSCIEKPDGNVSPR